MSKITLFNLFESQYGYSVLMRPQDVERLQQIVSDLPKEGGRIYLNKIKPETRAARAEERGIEVGSTQAAYIQFSTLDDTAGKPAHEDKPGRAPVAKPQPAKARSTPTREEF